MKIEKNKFDVLLNNLARVIETITGDKNVQVVSRNISEKKEYHDKYLEFKKRYSYPEELRQQIIEDRKHLYEQDMQS